jgi:FAD/FMN-containing dehydrogenase
MNLNDVHSRLNHTSVAEVHQIDSVGSLQRTIACAQRRGQQISVAGGRHAMGGQQFGTNTIHLDMTPLNRVVDFDAERGLITVEAGIQWPELVSHLLWAGAGEAGSWGIIQKQTGADRLTIGGAVAANIHGRGLRMKPFVDDIESMDVVDPDGALTICSRSRHPNFFRAIVGGYGLFGIVARVTLRLAPRRKVERRVRIVRADDVPNAFASRIDEGFAFGDFQFAIDPRSDEFLQTGVFSCYREVEDDRPVDDAQRQLCRQDWRRLLLLAHTDKSTAFAEYARYYMSTDGQVYWSDTHQLASYIDDYHEAIDRHCGNAGSEMITELFVPRASLPAFLAAVREDARERQMNVIYGTVRLIEKDDETLLAWAREPWACVVFNLHVDHTAEAIEKAAGDFRHLIDIASWFGGSYYLTYHRWATRRQVERCHPRFHEFLDAKAAYDPDTRFTSDWHRHHLRLMGSRP